MKELLAVEGVVVEERLQAHFIQQQKVFCLLVLDVFEVLDVTRSVSVNENGVGELDHHLKLVGE